MKWKHSGRTLLCLLLVCVLLVNIAPVRAEASVTGALGYVVVQAAPLLKAAAIGLGVYLTDRAVDDLVDYFTADGLVDRLGNTSAYHIGDGVFGLSCLVLDSILDYFYEEEIITTGDSYFTELYCADSPYGEATYKADIAFNIVMAHPGSLNNTITVFYSNSPGTIYRTSCPGWGDGSIELNWQWNGYYFTGVSQGYNEDYTGYPFHDFGVFERSGSSTYDEALDIIKYFVNGYVFTDSEYELGSVAPYGTRFDSYDPYLTWYDNGIHTEDGDDIVAVGSIAVSGTPAQNYTQEDVWTGQVPIIIIDQTGTGGSTEPSEPDDEKDPIYPMDPNYTTMIERLFGNVSDKIEYVAYSIEEIPEILREFMKEVKEGLERLPGQFKEWFDDIRTKLQQLVSGQITLGDLLSGLVKPIRNAVVDALSYLFAPSETFIQSKVETLIAKYPTADTFFNLGNSLGAFFGGLGATPPIIYIDLGAAEGSYLLGGREVFLDLTWYSRYKPTVDAIIGAFIWLWLAWRVFLSIPSIIHGEAGSWGDRKTDIGASNTSGATIVHQRELPSGKK